MCTDDESAKICSAEREIKRINRSICEMIGNKNIHNAELAVCYLLDEMKKKDEYIKSMEDEYID